MLFRYKMEKLPMCRICLVQNVRMFIVVNRNLRDLYEKLTDIPFVTEDSRPNLACFICCAKLRQCYKLLRQCLEAEELFSQKINDNYELNPLINEGHFGFYSEFIKTPTENISIVDVIQTESTIKQELPAVCEGLDVIEPKEEHQSGELEPDNLDNSCIDVADIPTHHSESDFEDDVPVMEFKTEVEEEQEVSKKKRRARETTSSNVAKKPKLDTRRTKEKDAITTEPMSKDKSDSKIIRTTQIRTSKPGTSFKEPYKCDQRSFSEKSNLTSHIQMHTGKNPYTCDVCQRKFSHKSHLSQHTRIHTGEKPYRCDVCQRSFSSKSNLTNHVRNIHSGEKPFKCDVCQRSFTKKDHLSRHIRVHIREKPYKCDVCQRCFSDQISLSRHIRIHTGETPYKCDVCQRSFTKKDHLSRHIRVHTGEKPYKCDVCQRCLRDQSSLSRHIRTHTGEKPYKCDVCQRCFSDRGNLTIHIRVHTGEKPYKCDACQRCFSDRRCLTKHIRIHTGEKPYRCMSM